jgi:hypothetical protein
MNKILCADLMSAVGHVNINRFYFKEFEAKFETHYFIGRSLSKKFERVEFVYDDRFLFSNSVIRNVFIFILIFRLTLKCYSLSVDKLILTSYPIYFIPIISLLTKLIGVQVILFEHNTVLSLGARLKKIWIKFNCGNLKRLFYLESPINNYSGIPGVNYYIDHPILPPLAISELEESKEVSDHRSYEYICFCPSSNADANIICNAVITNKNIFFIIKDSGEKINVIRKAKNVFISKYFDNYSSILSGCDLIYIPFALLGRVSGPFFEGLGANKVVVVDFGEFGTWAVNRFDGPVTNDLKKVGMCSPLSNEYIDDYNDKLIGKILEVVSSE